MSSLKGVAGTVRWTPNRRVLPVVWAVGCALALAGCQLEAQKPALDHVAASTKSENTPAIKSATTPSNKTVASEDVSRSMGYDKTGKPYTVSGKLYVPQEQKTYSATGLASWYGAGFNGRETANGEVFNRESVTVAHPTLPLPSYVRVTNVLNGRSIIARVNDRGPFKGNRLVDVSEQVATGLNFKHLGTARLRVDYIGRAPVNVDDSALLQATLRIDGTAAQLDGRGVASSKMANRTIGDRPSSFTHDPFGDESRTSFERADGGAGAGAGAVQARDVVPLPPQRPFSMGESGFKPSFEGLKIIDKSKTYEVDALNESKAVSGKAGSAPMLTGQEASEADLQATDLPERIPLPPRRPIGLGQDLPAERTASFESPVVPGASGRFVVAQ